MRGKHGKAPKRAQTQRRSSRRSLWLVATALVALIAALGGAYVWADQQARGEVRGELVAASPTQDIGTVHYSGGLAEARFALVAQGGPVVVNGISTT